MSWRFPKFPVRNGLIPNVDDVNANFREVTNEMGGKLNEQNWHKGTVDKIREVEANAAFVWHSAQRSHIDFFGGTTTGRHTITLNSNWVDVDDCSMTMQTAEGMLYILSSFQVSPGSTGDLDVFDQVMTLYGLKLDGLVIPESIIGTGEEQNDVAGGVAYGAIPLATSIIVPISSGTHTLSLVCRTPMPGVISLAKNKSIYLYDRELIALEIRR